MIQQFGLKEISREMLAILVNVANYFKREPAECLGAMCGGLGALLLSQNTLYSKWGWIGFLLSNVLFMAMAWNKRLMGLLLVQFCFTYTSINGVFNYF